MLRLADLWPRSAACSAAHTALEAALVKYGSAEGKAVRKKEREAVDKKSLELERVQDQIDQAKRRKLCMLIADAEAKAKRAAAKA